jgi:hypothetical protein
MHLIAFDDATDSSRLRAGATRPYDFPYGFPMIFLRRLESLIGVFKRLFGILESGLVIYFSGLQCFRTVRVFSEFVEFGGSLV